MSEQIGHGMQVRSLSAALVVCLSLASGLVALGCRSPAPSNRPIAGSAAGLVSGLTLGSPERSGRILLALTFSGGGTRAAAFSYGVLAELAETPVQLDGEQHSILDEIDLISSVSGGSFTAAYFGLHGDSIFDDYEDVFLRRNVQRGLAFEVIRPRYWLGLLGVDRSQLAARYYDRKIFHGATFADMDRPGAPTVILNATDLSTAGRFSFTPMFFGPICSDLASYPVAEAVTASSAVPIVFPTVRLHNYVGTCDFEPPDWVTTDQPGDTLDLRGIVREELGVYLASMEEREYIHLLDGGVSDNLGLVNGIAALAVIDDADVAMRDLGHEDLELIVLVTVNAETETERPWDRLDKGASAFQVVNGLSGAQIEQTNKIVVSVARATFTRLAEDLSKPGRPVHFRHVELGFANVPDPEEQQYLRRIETSFSLSDTKVDRLIGAGRRLVRESPELAEALSILDAPRDER